MKTTMLTMGVMTMMLWLLPSAALGQTPMGTAFAYQGELKKAGLPVTDAVDFEFTLWDALAGGNQVGLMYPAHGVSVERGLFAVQLDVGSDAFGGEARWLEIAVKGSADPGFTTLSPRQELTPTPYAIYAAKAGTVQGVIRGEGTANYIPKFTGTRRIGNSLIYESTAGNIGIDTTEPAEKLDVNGTLRAPAINLNGDTRTQWPTIPSGAIIMWSGPISSIPTGWALCDGTQGTPDLTSRFIRCVPDASTNPGSTGGSPTHSHGAGSYSAAAHTHHYSGITAGPSSTDTRGDKPERNASPTHTHTYSGTTDAGGGGAISGTSAETSSLPPYFELAFIMRL